MQSYGLSHKGHIRKVNQDAFFQKDTPIGVLDNLYILADGMGGHKGGEIASKLAVDIVINYIQNATPNQKPIEVIQEAMLEANKRVYQRAIKDVTLHDMGTTLIVACIYQDKLYMTHVGDSRLYVYTDQLEQMTVDHSYVQELVDRGAITEEEAKRHPEKNKITRAVGVQPHLIIDSHTIEWDKNNYKKYIIMCSDGLTNMVEEKDIMKIMETQSTPQILCEKLMEAALNEGGRDNVTCIVIQNN